MELDLRLGHSTQKPLVEFVNKTRISEPPVQLDLMLFAPVQGDSSPIHDLRFEWLTRENDTPTEEGEDGSIHTDADCSGTGKRKRDLEKQFMSIKVETDQRGGTSSRGSDEEENTLGRKKLRLSKEQSAFLEESFKEHHTLNSKQKLILAKQLGLTPRQVEVWFQNRRARTKLKQTEIDCEYLRRYCETLREENRKIQKELQELRALDNTNSTIINPFPITMCPSCERVATSTSTCSLTSLAC